MKSITIIIPLYNMAFFIERAVRSVLAQTFTDFQLIVVDDGSTDGGGELVKKIKDDRIKLIQQENQGVSAARNTGIAAANSELIVFLDADDYWKPGFLEEIIALRQKFPEAGIYATNYQTINLHGIATPSFNILKSGKERGLINFFKMIKHNTIIIQAVAIPKKIFEKVGGFHQGEFILEDLDLLLKVALRYPVAWSSKPLVVYDQLDWHKKNSKRFNKIIREPQVIYTIRKAITDGIVTSGNEIFLKEAAAAILLGQAKYLLQYGDKKLAQEFIKTSLNFDESQEGSLLLLASFLPKNIFYSFIIPFMRKLKNEMLNIGIFKKIYMKIINKKIIKNGQILLKLYIFCIV